MSKFLASDLEDRLQALEPELRRRLAAESADILGRLALGEPVEEELLHLKAQVANYGSTVASAWTSALQGWLLRITTAVVAAL